MVLGLQQGFRAVGSPSPLKHSLLRSSGSVRCATGPRTQASLGDFYSSAQWRQHLHSGHHTPDPIDEEWKMMRRRMDSGLDAGVPSTSGRPPSSSSSSSSSRSSSRGHPYSQNQLPNGYNLEDSWDLTDDSGYTPFPVNLPAGSGGVGGNASAHGMDLWSGGAPALGLHDSREAWSKLGQVYVLLFGVGQSDTEGIYSLRAMSREEGLPEDTIVAFEDLEDAERYCTLLQATMPHVPHVMPIEPGELLDFCGEAGYAARLERAGSWFTPPDYNVGMTDWERSLRLREGQYSVLEADPVPQSPADPPPAAEQLPPAQQDQLPPMQQHQQPPPYFGRAAEQQRYHNNAGAYFSHELEELKARLERLLPSEEE